MKIWQQWGSEHSHSLIMIGSFKTAADATEAMRVFQAIQKQAVLDDESSSRGNQGERFGKMSKKMLELLIENNLLSFGHDEPDQLVYEMELTKRTDTELMLTTDEIDVSGILKIFLHNGGKVEIFSAHDYDRPKA